VLLGRQPELGKTVSRFCDQVPEQRFPDTLSAVLGQDRHATDVAGLFKG